MDIKMLITSQIIFAIATAFAAEKRGGAPMIWFVIGAVLGPIAFMLALANGKKCKHCHSTIPSEATACSHCTREQ